MDGITVPTYHRGDTIGQHTLTTLAKAGVDMSLVHVYVGGGDYTQARDKWPTCNWHAAPPGKGPAENHIRDQWPRGAHLIGCDDDITHIQHLDSAGKKLIDADKDWWDTTTAQAFRFLQRERLSIWGVSHSRNSFYMTHQWKVGAYPVVGYFYGHINNPDIRITEPGKQDIELSLLHYERDGALVRLNDVSIGTKPMREYAGGLQHDGHRTELERQSTVSLLKRFPSLVEPVTNGRHEQDDLRMKIRAQR